MRIFYSKNEVVSDKIAKEESTDIDTTAFAPVRNVHIGTART